MFSKITKINSQPEYSVYISDFKIKFTFSDRTILNRQNHLKNLDEVFQKKTSRPSKRK